MREFKCAIGCLAVVGLIFAAPVSARFLPQSYAYNAALKDARERSSDLVGSSLSYGVDGCKRQARGRVGCKVHAEGREFVLGEELGEGYYHHKRCTWTVVSHYRRSSSLVYYFRRGTRCRSWDDPYS